MVPAENDGVLMSQLLDFKRANPVGKAAPSHLVFSNPGSLDINLVKLLGVSVKEGANPIGFFGTGLKYAMATSLRLGGSMTIFTDDQRYEVIGKPINLRGKDFVQVCLNDEPLGFTTELGKQWEAWMVVRELYSNTLDEGGETSIQRGEVSPGALSGRTIIALHGEAFLNVWHDRERYLISPEDKPLHASIYVNAHSAPVHNHSVFYRGVRVSAPQKPTIYRYNIQENVKLTEDRTLMYEWQFREALEKAIISSEDQGYIEELLTAADSYFESTLYFTESYAAIEPSTDFLAVCRRLNQRRPHALNMAAMRWYQKRSQTSQPMVPAKLTKVQQAQLEKATAFVEQLALCDQFRGYPIEVMSWLGEGIYGKALEGRILLSKDCFDKGTKFLASTIFEEFVHVHYGYGDETRELQTWLFDRIVTMGEEFMAGVPL